MWNRIEPEPLRETVDGARWYRFPGQTSPVPSVTTIIAQTDGRRWGLERWREELGPGNADKVTDIAARRGQELHRLIELRLRSGIEPEVKTVWWKSVEMSVRQMATAGEVLLCEGAVFHPLYRYAGTVDMVVRMGRWLYVVDWLTAAEVHKLDRLRRKGDQIAAYAEAIEYQYGERVDGGLAITALPDRPAHIHRVALDEARKRWQERVQNFHGQ